MQTNKLNETLIGDIYWASATVRLGDLQDYQKNPRQINKTEFNNLVRSLKEDGYHQRMLVNQDGTIIGGHQRKRAMLKAGYTNDSIIEVLVPNIPLSTVEFDRLNIRDNLSYGTYDFDMLSSNFDTDTLLDWGMPPDMLLGKEDKEDTGVKETRTKICPHCGEALN